MQEQLPDNGLAEVPCSDMAGVTDGFVLVSGGTFVMGSPEDEACRSGDERQHTVTVSDFYISPYEVTQAEYEALAGRNPSSFEGGGAAGGQL